MTSTCICPGWFNTAHCSSIIPENLIDSAKLYDYYVNDSNDWSKSAYTAWAHLNMSGSSSHTSSAPATDSFLALMNLVNADNVEPQDVDLLALEEQWYNHLDPYDLSETKHVDEQLWQPSFKPQNTLMPLITWSQAHQEHWYHQAWSCYGTWWSQKAAIVGMPGEWSIDSFL